MNICCMDTPIFWLIDCITPNSKLSCSFYAYISYIRYQSLNFDLSLIIVEIWADLSKVASTIPGFWIFWIIITVCSAFLDVSKSFDLLDHVMLLKHSSTMGYVSLNFHHSLTTCLRVFNILRFMMRSPVKGVFPRAACWLLYCFLFMSMQCHPLLSMGESYSCWQYYSNVFRGYP